MLSFTFISSLLFTYYIFKWLIGHNIRKGHQNLEKISYRDSMWLLDDVDSNAMYINAVLITEKITLEEVRYAVATRGIVYYPRLKKRIVYVDNNAYWDDISDSFNINDHVIKVNEDMDEIQLKQYITNIWPKPLCENKPMWQYLVIENYENNQSAVIFRVHHAYADGISLVKFCLTIMDDFEKPIKRVKVGLKKQSIFRLFLSIILFPIFIGAKFFWRSDNNPLHKNQKLTNTRAVDWTSECIPLKKVKEVKNKLNVSLNDVLMSSLAGAIRKYFQSKGHHTNKDTIVTIPISLRQKLDVGTLDNDVSLIYVSLFTSIEDPIQRVLATHNHTIQHKNSLEVMSNVYTVKTLSVLPPYIAAPLCSFLASKNTAVCTNVPGPPTALYFNGKKIHNMHFWVPGMGTIGVGLAILSYNDKVSIGISTDVSLCKTPGHICQLFLDEFDKLYQITITNKD